MNFVPTDKWTVEVRSSYIRNYVNELQAGNNWTALLGNAMNGNPLIRYDAYYILVDLIEMPNLAQRALRDERGELLAPRLDDLDHAQAGGQRGVARWFGELGSGLVDWTAVMTALRETGYAGWLVVESDQGPAPQAAAMMQNAWTVRHVLQPLLAHGGSAVPTL